MGRTTPALALILVLLAATSLVRAAHQPTPPELLAERIRDEIAAGGPRADRALAALRELRDPALRPLFSQLAAGPHPEQRWHGALGRAELETPPTLDPFLLAKLPTPEEQLVVVEAAWREGLLTIEGVRDLLARNDLAPPVEVFLRLADASTGAPTDPKRIAELAATSPLGLRTRARLSLLTLEGERDAAAALPEDLAALLTSGDMDSLGALTAALDDAAQLPLNGAMPLAAAALAALKSEPLVRAAALRAMLAIDPPRAEAGWIDAFEDPTYGFAERLRLALIAVHEPQSPEPVLERLRASDEPLIAAIGDAALGLRRGEVDAAVRLVNLRYLQALSWLVARAGEMESADAEVTLLAVIDLAERTPTSSWEQTEQMIRAAEALAARNPELFLARMRRAVEANDRRTEQVMLLGALRPAGEGVCPQTLGAASADPECQALAMIAAARATDGASAPELVERLQAVAGGDGALHAARRVQAAWLALRLTGDERLALARILAPDPS